MELDNYGLQSYARTQDYVKTFMRANVLLNGRSMVTNSDLYDLVHPLFVNSMGELGIENHILSVIRKNPQVSDQELIEKSGVSPGSFYKYKKILRSKGTIGTTVHVD